MSKPSIIEINKNLNAYAKDVLDKVVVMQNASQLQLKSAKLLEADLIPRIREYKENLAQAALEEKLAREKQEAMAQAREQKAEAALAPEKPVVILQ